MNWKSSRVSGKIQRVLSSHLKQKNLNSEIASALYFIIIFFLSPLSVDMFVEYRSVYITGAREIGNTILLSLITRYQNTVLN